MFRIKKHFQVEVNFASLAVGRYDIGDQPDLRGKRITGIESDLINGLYDDTITEEDMNGIINGLADDDDSVGDGDDY